MTKKEIGTLVELGVKPGDVVECVESANPDHIGVKLIVRDDGIAVIQSEKYKGGTITISFDTVYGRKYRIVSRASDTLKTWNEMTDEELVALLLADHRGEVIEWRHPQDVYDDWDTENLRFGIPYMAYRVRPPEPKRETVTAYVYQDCGFKAVGTIDLIDGTPDCASISMEEL